MRASVKRLLFRASLLGPTLWIADASAQSRFHFSTERDFAATQGPKAGQLISQGDECRDDGERLLSNAQLMANFCPEAIPVNGFGLDALHRTGTLTWFSTEQGWFDECLNQLITDGDLLNIDGGVITNAQLMFPFALPPPFLLPGLDAVHLNFDIAPTGGPPPNNSIWFSIEEDTFSGSLGVVLQHGDILSSNGTIVATNQQLIQNFCPKPVQPDVGLDGLYLPRNGEIWFSIETGFFSECLGVQINEGDVLSNAGYIVKREPELLAAFGAIVPGPLNAGLDAIWVDERQPLQDFSGCGTLAIGPQGCIRFVDEGGTGYFIENSGSFSVGDRVWVEGLINPQSQVCAPFTAPGIVNNTIAACVDGCFTLEPGPQGCPIIRRDNSGAFLFVENTGAFNVGDRVWITGCFNPQSTVCAPFIGPAVVNNTIGECFADCGTLVETPFGCAGIETDQGLRLIENRGSFNVGERVWVEGCLTFNAPICVTNAIPVVLDNRIGPCFEDCGVLVAGILCTQLQTESGELFALENFDAFGPGDEVWVKGCVNPNSQLCPPLPAFPGIESNTIGRCFKGCGEIRPGPQGCPVFVGPNSQILFIENIGNLPLDEPVWVTGCLNPESRVCLPFIRPGIEDNRVGRCIEVCGRVVQGPECVLLAGDDGVTYWIENRQGADIGARIRVRGCRGPDITPCLIDVPFPSILDNELDLLGDMNCDGFVTVGDIAGFVLAITNPAAYQQQFPNCDITHADINCDGFVTVGDIGPFVRLLTGP